VRRTNVTGPSSVVQESHPPHPPVCSEGYEYPVGKNKIVDQDPVFQAANQLTGAFLGFISRRLKLNNDTVERFVPVLVTTAKLLVVRSDLSQTDILTGGLGAPPSCLETDFLILKHPFATPEGTQNDFRDKVQDDTWTAMHRESIYVVRSSGLKKFFEISHRDFMHDVENA
jgi:hypothetical protein